MSRSLLSIVSRGRYCMDACFWVDILFNFRTAYVDESHDLIVDPQRLGKVFESRLRAELQIGCRLDAEWYQIARRLLESLVVDCYTMATRLQHDCWKIARRLLEGC